MRVIINSDDFGYSIDVNKATMMAFQQKLISSTTCLVNFDEGFKDAVSIIKSDSLTNIGIHINLFEGIPLTQDILKCDLFCSNGHFHGKVRDTPVFFLTNKEHSAVRNEIKAQIEKFISAVGYKPTHLDSHQHVHTEWGICKAIIQNAKFFGIRSIRLTRNMGEGITFLKWLYKSAFNLRLRLNGFLVVSKFGSIDDFQMVDINHDPIEIEVHALLLNGELIDLDERNLQQKLNSLFGDKMPELSSYISCFK